MNKWLSRLTVILILLLIIGACVFPVNAGIFSKNTLILHDNKDISINELLFDLRIKSLMRISHMPSLSVGIIKKDNLVWSNYYGFSDLKHRVRASKETVYLIYRYRILNLSMFLTRTIRQTAKFYRMEF